MVASILEHDPAQFVCDSYFHNVPYWNNPMPAAHPDGRWCPFTSGAAASSALVWPSRRRCPLLPVAKSAAVRVCEGRSVIAVSTFHIHAIHHYVLTCINESTAEDCFLSRSACPFSRLNSINVNLDWFEVDDILTGERGEEMYA